MIDNISPLSFVEGTNQCPGRINKSGRDNHYDIISVMGQLLYSMQKPSVCLNIIILANITYYSIMYYPSCIYNEKPTTSPVAE